MRSRASRAKARRGGRCEIEEETDRLERGLLGCEGWRLSFRSCRIFRRFNFFNPTTQKDFSRFVSKATVFESFACVGNALESCCCSEWRRRVRVRVTHQPSAHSLGVSGTVRASGWDVWDTTRSPSRTCSVLSDVARCRCLWIPSLGRLCWDGMGCMHFGQSTLCPPVAPTWVVDRLVLLLDFS